MTSLAQVRSLSAPSQKPRSLWRNAFRRLIRNRMSMLSLVIVFLLFFIAIFGPALSPYDYTRQDIYHTNAPPSLEHLLGTDELGRDMLSRLMWGARTALEVALISQGLSYSVGALLGAISAYGSATVDAVIMRIADIFMSFPHLLLAVFVSATIRTPVANEFYNLYIQTGIGFFHDTVMLDYLIVFGALALASWPWAARLIRGQILTLRELDYVLAARSSGATTWQIIRWHLIPNSLGPIIVGFTAGFGGAMLAESSLSYLGVGIRPPGASWGAMINEALIDWRVHPYLVAMPGLVLAICVFAFNLFGDGLNDALNPRSSND